jgi:phosphoribosyl-AMP cyclohydrolase
MILNLLCGYPATNRYAAAGRLGLHASNRNAETPMSDTEQREMGKTFMPKFDSNGLLSAIVQDVASGEVLMFAFMNPEALAKTQETGIAHFWSRSRGQLWMKGESSGNTLKLVEMLVDCDQDALLLKVEPAGPACHTGQRSCFYRAVDGMGLRSIHTDL